MITKEKTTPITKEEFLEHVECGWKRTGFTTGTFWRGKKLTKTSRHRMEVNDDSDAVDNLLIVGASCAVGAAALSQKMTPTNYIAKYLPSSSPYYHDSLVSHIYDANDGSRSKEKAIEKIKNIEWPSLKK